jgi:MFS family permease
VQIAPTEVRGALGSVNQLVICLGILGALLVNVVYPPTAWRAMLWLSAVPAVVLGIGARALQASREHVSQRLLILPEVCAGMERHERLPARQRMYSRRGGFAGCLVAR